MFGLRQKVNNPFRKKCRIFKNVCGRYTFRRDTQKSESFEHCAGYTWTWTQGNSNWFVTKSDHDKVDHVPELRLDHQRDWLKGEMWHNVLMMWYHVIIAFPVCYYLCWVLYVGLELYPPVDCSLNIRIIIFGHVTSAKVSPYYYSSFSPVSTGPLIFCLLGITN